MSKGEPIEGFVDILVKLSPETEALLAGSQSVPVSLDGFTEWELVALMALGHMHGVEGVICWTPESLSGAKETGWEIMPLGNLRSEP